MFILNPYRYSAPANPLLDTYSGAAAAYSLRKLRTAYSGSAIRVRRSSDNTEQDIGFDGNGNLDESSLTTFVGSNSGYVTKWYDQSGNARDASQTTSSQQPWVIFSGTLQKVGTRVYLYFQGNTGIKYLSTSSGIFSGNSSRSIFCIYKSDKTDSVFTILNQGPASSPPTGSFTAIQCRIGGAAGDPYFAGYAQDLGNGLTTANANLKSANFIYNGTTGYLYKNASLITSGNLNLNANSANLFYIGAANASNEGFVGYIGDIIIYSSDQSSNRTGIESNINSNYQIYWQGNQQALLDTYSGSAAAYSLRNLSSSYTGPLIRVRRSNDNAEQDIYGTYSGALDETALTTFVGANSGYVTKWYDQSGNARDASQIIQARQPRIVNSGTIDKLNNKATIYYNISSFSITNAPTVTEWTAFQVVQRPLNNVYSIFFGRNGSPDGAIAAYYTTGGEIFIQSVRSGAGKYKKATDNTTVTTLFTSVLNTTTGIAGYKNGSSLSLGSELSFSASSTLFDNIGAASGNTVYGTGYCSEAILFPSDQSSNRTGIESNINSYYSIY